MSADDLRVEAVKASPYMARFTRDAAFDLLRDVDKADRAQGIYRVSLDAAIEAAAKHLAEADLGLGSWVEAAEEARAYWRRKLRSLVTAAVMGGAQ